MYGYSFKQFNNRTLSVSMIQEEGKYYLYRHIRLDKNEPFYIGIGTEYTITQKKRGKPIERARSKMRRNKIWNDIVKKTNYEIEIVLMSNDYDFIKQKEVEFIKLYGRKDLNLGTLANMTDGGEGLQGFNHSEETKNRIRQKNTGRKVSETTLLKRKLFWEGKERPKRSKKVYQYDLEGNFIREWSGSIEAGKILGCHDTTIRKVCVGVLRTCLGFKWFFEKKVNI